MIIPMDTKPGPGYLIERFELNRNGLALRGKKYIQRGVTSVPAVIIAHALGSNMWTVREYAEQLVNWGFAVFVLDFRGGCLRGLSDGDSMDLTLTSEISDLVEVYAMAAAQPDIDPSRISLMGFGFGGLVAAIAAASKELAVEKLILYNPAFCMGDDCRNGHLFTVHFDKDHLPETLLLPLEYGKNLPLSRRFLEEIMVMDPFAMIDGFKGDVFIMSSLKNEMMDPSYARRARDLYQMSVIGDLRQTSKRVQLYEVEEAPHFLTGDHLLTAVYGLEQFMHGKAEILHIDVKWIGRTLVRDSFETHVEWAYEGEAKGFFFKGRILPKAADEHEWGGHQRVKRCEQFMMDGVDYTGTPCQIHFKNTSAGRKQTALIWTDSKALAFLNDGEVLARQDKRPGGPVIRVFA